LPLASAKDYVARLGATGRGRTAPVPVTPTDATAPELSQANRLIHLVTSYLLKPELTPVERQAVVSCCRDVVSVRFDLAEAALRRLVAKAGRDLHICRYTTAIVDAHRKENHP
jgi:hypothetical protein